MLSRWSNRLASLSRLRNGSVVAPRSAPKPDLVLYEYEASPYCRRVRETLCILGLPALIKPCPRETLRREGAFSAEAKHKREIVASGGRLLFPFLADRTAGVVMNESSAIVTHLWKAYGSGLERPRTDILLHDALPRPLSFALLAAPSGLRPWPSCGLMMASPARSEAQVAPLILHGNEANGARRPPQPQLPSRATMR